MPRRVGPRCRDLAGTRESREPVPRNWYISSNALIARSTVKYSRARAGRRRPGSRRRPSSRSSLTQAPRQRRRVAWRHDQRRCRAERLGDAADVRGHARPPACHRLDQGVGEALGDAAQDEHMPRPRRPRGYRATRPSNVAARRCPAPRLSAGSAPGRPRRPCGGEPNIRSRALRHLPVHEGKRAQQRLQVLDRVDPPRPGDRGTSGSLRPAPGSRPGLLRCRRCVCGSVSRPVGLPALVVDVARRDHLGLLSTRGCTGGAGNAGTGPYRPSELRAVAGAGTARACTRRARSRPSACRTATWLRAAGRRQARWLPRGSRRPAPAGARAVAVHAPAVASRSPRPAAWARLAAAPGNICGHRPATPSPSSSTAYSLASMARRFVRLRVAE